MTIQTEALGPNSFHLSYDPSQDSKGTLLLEMHSKITAAGWEAWDKLSIMDDQDVYAGEFNHFAVLAEDNSVLSWGQNDFNQVTDTPASLDFTRVEAGGYHTVALRADGSLVAWGRDNDMQVTDTPAGTGFISIAAGAYHSYALKADGSIVGWGNDSNNQIADIPTESGFTQVIAGAYFGAALRADGSIVVWGQDADGQVSAAPAGTGYQQIAAGPFYVLALAADGSIEGWGRTSNGVLTLPSATGHTHIAAGVDHAVAVASDGSIVAWGDDSAGQVSDVPAGANFVSVDAGRQHSIASTDIGDVLSWGAALDPIDATLETKQYFSDPVEEITQRPTGALLSASRDTTVAIMADGTVKVWGDDSDNQVTDAPAGNTFKQVFSGAHHHFALRDDGSIIGWGNNLNNKVTDAPVRTDYVKVGVGGTHTVALLSDGSIIGWGNDSNNRISGAPTETGHKDLDAGYFHSVAIKADGSLVSWGMNGSNVVSNTPAGTGFKAISAGRDFTLALKDDGSIVAWGIDDLGQVTDAPVGTGFVSVYANEFNAVAVHTDGSIHVWGDDTYGQVTNAPAELTFIYATVGQKHGVAVREDGISIVWGDDSLSQITDAPASGFPQIEVIQEAQGSKLLYSESVIVINSGFEVAYRALNDDDVSYKYVHLRVEASNLYTEVFESWDKVAHTGTNLAYLSDEQGYSQRLRSDPTTADALRLFVSPRWLVVASNMGSSSGASFCGCLEIEQALEDEIPGEFPIYAWANGAVLYGYAMPETGDSQDQPIYGYSLPRTLKDETGDLGAKFMMVGTIGNSSLTLHDYDSEYCSRYSSGGRSTKAVRWDYRLHDMLPNGTNPYKGNTNFVFTPYASCVDPEFAHIRGRFHGLKLIGNNVGSFGDTIEIPVDEFGFYSPNSETMQNHFVFTNSFGGRLVLPL